MTGGLSYCLYIAAAIALHTAPSLTAVHYDSSNLNDIKDSRQFRQNMEVSKFKYDPDWMPTYELYPLDRFKNERRPFWESRILPDPLTKNTGEKTDGNWEEMMRKVTDERLKKWVSPGLKEKIDERGNNSDVANTALNKFDEGVSESSVNIDLDHTSMSSSEDFDNIETTVQSTVEPPKKEDFLSQSMIPYRWGMSLNRPPDRVIKEILNNDIHKLHDDKQILQGDVVNDHNDGEEKISVRFLPIVESDESSEHPNSRSSKKRKHPLESLSNTKIVDVTTQLPIVVSSSQEIVDSPKNTLDLNDKTVNPDETTETAIKIEEEKSRIFSPVLVLGPTFYLSKLPKTIKQKLKIHRPINLWNRFRSAQTTNDDHIPTKRNNQTDEPDYTGIYELY